MYKYTHTHTHTHTHAYRHICAHKYIHIFIYTHTCTHNGLLLRHKKNKILPFAETQTDLENIILSELSQTEKEKHHMISLVCGI